MTECAAALFGFLNKHGEAELSDYPRKEPEPDHSRGAGLTREQILWAYRVLLDRDPESEKAFVDAGSYGSMQRLRAEILACAEFLGRNRPVAGGVERSVPPFPTPPVSNRSPAMPCLKVEVAADQAVLAALLTRVKRVWEKLGEERPHWSVLSADEFSPDRIVETEIDFYRSGAADVANLLAALDRAGVDPAALGTLFEFGCGIGRVTAHLARYFPRVLTCDVSRSHIRLAEAVLAAGGITNVSIVPAKLPDFGMAQPFDAWFSRIVLQHNPPPIMRLILQRALKLLTEGGVAIFQVPTYAAGYRFRLDEYLARPEDAGEIEMHVLPQVEVFRIAECAGCFPLEVTEDESIGVQGWISSLFVLRKGQRWQPCAGREPG